MSREQVTPAMWKRMPWHAKAKAIARLDAELERMRHQIDHAADMHRQAYAEEVAANIAAAKTYLARRGPDPDGIDHLRVLAGVEVPHDSRGRFCARSDDEWKDAS